MQHKLNAAGLEPERSMLLPERQAVDADEQHIVKALQEIYMASQPTPAAWDIFSPDVILTLPSGEVAVGMQAVKAKLMTTLGVSQRRTVKLRLLQSPASLPPLSIVADVTVTAHAPRPATDENEPSGAAPSDDSPVCRTTQNLVVIKRRTQDGKVTNISEEEGHRRPTAPLIARAAAASNFLSHSPTDDNVSPCTSKLNLTKKKHFSKAKPTTLFPATARPMMNASGNNRPSRMAQQVQADDHDMSDA